MAVALGAGAPVVQLSVGLSAALDDGGCGSCGGDDATLGEGVYLGALVQLSAHWCCFEPLDLSEAKEFQPT